ncbi:Metal-dependent hydrolase YbeY, involved in rRNA and/or ribosome maturation and assembly [hydrothermal vent metagenome]|uniref:Metal-dependent hydrolase YbeY, involved in rRNA and/or ribosome maturation and assembly n=1 Tax=hydrothermal vent metagenome TaxID=652676 RepID=A0A3B0U3A5_9ZZZZ
MIQFNYETNFKLQNEEVLKNWISTCIDSHGFKEGELNYIFCNDEYLLKLNIEFLNHDTFTDILSFDYTLGKLVGGDIFISIDRVKDNANKFSQHIDNELNRVMIHGVLHFMGYQDKTAEEKVLMRNEEDRCLILLKSR